MLNRRQFLSAAAGTVMFAGSTRASAAQAATYDLIIKGGRVIDPSVRLDAIRDVAISAGRIAAVEANIPAHAADNLDARGKLVVPGLLDIHTHAARSADGPGLVLQDGVTGWIDAGSQGADHIADTIAVARSGPQLGRVLINIGRAGMVPEVLAARRRGVWFDVGNGQAGHMRWDTVGAIMKAGFWPDTFSTDWNTNSHTTGVIDLPNCMSKLFGYGMTLKEAIARATLNAARIFPVFSDRGTLNAGAPADVAILDLREGHFEFLDNYKNTIAGRQRLFPFATVLAGKQIRHT